MKELCRILCGLFGAMMFINGMITYINAKSAIHQILATNSFVASGVFILGAILLLPDSKTKKVKQEKVVEEVDREDFDDFDEIMEKEHV
jgi:hypothetical protein